MSTTTVEKVFQMPIDFDQLQQDLGKELDKNKVAQSKAKYRKRIDKNCEYSRRYYATHKEQHKQSVLRWRKANRKKYLAIRRRYHRLHREQEHYYNVKLWASLTAEQRAQKYAKVNEWRKQHPEKVQEYNRRVREKRRKAKVKNAQDN